MRRRYTIMGKSYHKEEEFLNEYGNIARVAVRALKGEWEPNFGDNDNTRKNQEYFLLMGEIKELVFAEAWVYHDNNDFSSAQIILESSYRIVNVKVKVVNGKLVGEKIVDKQKRKTKRDIMEAKLFSQSEKGGFDNAEDLRNWLDTGLRDDGIYLLARIYAVPVNSLIFFEMAGTIIGCAIVQKEPHEMSEADKHDYKEDTGEDWKAIMRLDTKTIWVWHPEQDVSLKEVGIHQFLPGPPMSLTPRNVLKIFQLVAQRSRRLGAELP